MTYNKQTALGITQYFAFAKSRNIFVPRILAKNTIPKNSKIRHFPQDCDLKKKNISSTAFNFIHSVNQITVTTDCERKQDDSCQKANPVVILTFTLHVKV